MNTETNLDEHNPVNKIEGGGECGSDGHDPVLEAGGLCVETAREG